MTSPDGAIPDGSISETGLAAFATKTQYTWQSDLRTTLSNRFLPAQLGFLNIFGAVSVAQRSANFANVTNTIAKATSLAAAVTGGVAVSDPFSGSAASTLGASWSRTSDGAGAGTYGPNGSGTAVWTQSGNSFRRHVDRYTTPLATNIQAVMTVMSKPPARYSLNTDGYTYLLGRMNSSGNTFVYCRIGPKTIAVGKCVSGTWSDPWKTVDTNNLAGDQYIFLLGTNGSLREFLVIKNGYVQVQHTDVTSSDTTGLYVGLASAAQAGYPLSWGSTQQQVVPGELDLFAAADRQSAIV
jgi:hypothetical protein